MKKNKKENKKYNNYAKIKILKRIEKIMKNEGSRL